MSNVQSNLNSLLVSCARDSDPVVLTVLQEIVDELDRIAYLVDPPPEVSKKISSVARVIPGIVPLLTYSFTTRNVILRWLPPDFNFQFYELRKGTNWDTASRLLVTNNIEATLDPITIGSHTYLLKTISVDGLPSEETASVVVVVPEIGLLNITAEVSINNVLLRWDKPESTFDIANYTILKNGMQITVQDGQFFVYSEIAAGTYKYTVISTDIAGNNGPETHIIVDVGAFPDFQLQKSITSDFSGIKINAKLDLATRLIVALNLTETIEQHFLTRSWGSPQDQINAGYPLWITPLPTTASYEETFDFGLIFTFVIVSLSWVFEVIDGQFNFGIDAKVSDDGINFTGNYTTQTFFVPSVRFVKVKISFTSSNDRALMAFSNYMIALSVKREQDAGMGVADASDVNGTVVTFNKVFKDVEGITIAPMSTSTVIPIVEFLDVPNPTYFRVKIFDNAGVRRTVQFRWDARGVV